MVNTAKEKLAFTQHCLMIFYKVSFLVGGGGVKITLLIHQPQKKHPLQMTNGKVKGLGYILYMVNSQILTTSGTLSRNVSEKLPTDLYNSD
jgi:hypothetical protein